AETAKLCAGAAAGCRKPNRISCLPTFLAGPTGTGPVGSWPSSSATYAAFVCALARSISRFDGASLRRRRRCRAPKTCQATTVAHEAERLGHDGRSDPALAAGGCRLRDAVPTRSECRFFQVVVGHGLVSGTGSEERRLVE